MSIRGLNIIVGVWLFISAFVWPHTMDEQTDTWICGVLAVVFAAIAMRQPQVRFLNTLLGIWLFLSSLGLPHQLVGTLWNNCVVAVVIFVISLIPGGLPTAGTPSKPAPV